MLNGCDICEEPRQSGFTLVEVLIVLILLGILSTIFLVHIDESSARGKTLYLALSSVSHSAEAFDVSLGVYPTVYAAMFNPAFEQDNSGGANLSKTWNGPYAKARHVGPGGNLHLDRISSGVVVTFNSILGGGSGGSASNQYDVVANNVPPQIAVAAIRDCNDSSSASGSTGPCTLVKDGQYDQVYYTLESSQYGAIGNSQNYSLSSSLLSGNGMNMSSYGGSFSLNTPQANVYSSGYSSSITYSPSGGFNGCLNITGTAEVGHVCGGNSGICGSGNTITANSSPLSSCAGGNAYSAGGESSYATQTATGGPISYQGGQFSGSPIVVNYIGPNGNPHSITFTPNGTCMAESVNGQNVGNYCP
ncbi:prepilin-type N-terminal cleavage/methylation domain-containing protein [Acidithiobacillus ferridurans]|uniref:Prepilin-type N-terminal cleavage/methylation domain-containing protein n=1 Tax=Acidithiobacillus ferridurans TaxID=1232575 RepID=A0A8X8GB09_ACIFI|nr:prepilin-type N-terminal cleavage/methylation domain-containing protein [Acidithiobacillus ferridurans]MBU2715824.1 prepilin-type N-terminal cleavage/methylation domain-containing protein [Acidithiobacillus ferridurans]MBU2722821.1 prepilin-type N-terminal cleavage/methylation domain-containing protein [Acidithiobacillus ferridurans]MBU2727792.1 prepilin-type N-terminal cleavage/methylation domain-containing protein [Acidithiobacillus ferridurans]